MTSQVKTTIQALQRHNMGAHYVEKASDVIALLEQMIEEDDVVTLGGSMSLADCKIPEWLQQNENISYLDRYAPDADVDEIYHDAFFANVYLTSSNAITMDGQLVNMDGNANRIAAMAFGPARVIVVAGINKIVENEAAARRRIAKIAAPKNTKRLHCNTPCATSGTCENCRTDNPNSICCSLLIQGMQRKVGRIQVILVGEELGF